jgi:ectoine hydroxylase-related dioxygenase (phytanoyl-CoA dioxygenase family)
MRVNHGANYYKEMETAMNTTLTGSQIELYRTNGFIVIENFLNQGELESWRTNTQEAVDQRLAGLTYIRSSFMDKEKSTPSDLTASLKNNQLDPDDYYAQVFTQCLKLAETHEGMHELMFDKRLGEFAGKLAGVDGIRIWHDQALFKPPFGNATGWHLDNPFWSFSSKDAISIWVALDDATLGNGCLYYLPGTQDFASFQMTNIGRNQADLFKIYPEWRDLESVAAPAKAGTAVFHNGLTAHGAGANMTNRPRRAMTCAYMPDGSVFNGVQNILSDDYFNSLKVGDKLDNNEVNPLIWHK